MPSGKNIIAIFKKSYFLSELSSLISYEGYQIKVFKSLSEIIKNSNNTKILFIDFTLDKNLKELSKAIERTNSATKIFIFTKKIFNFENFEKEIHIINLPIVLRDFFKLLKKVAGGIDDVNYHIRIGSFVFFPKRSILASENMLSEINLTELENKFLEYLIKKKVDQQKMKFCIKFGDITKF